MSQYTVLPKNDELGRPLTAIPAKLINSIQITEKLANWLTCWLSPQETTVNLASLWRDEDGKGFLNKFDGWVNR